MTWECPHGPSCLICKAVDLWIASGNLRVRRGPRSGTEPRTTPRVRVAAAQSRSEVPVELDKAQAG